MNTSIFSIDLNDANHGIALLNLLDRYSRDHMGGGKPLTENVQRQLISRLQARPDYCGFLAFNEQQPVGFINCFEGFSTFSALPLLNIHDVFVHQDFRGRGLARQLLQSAEKAALARGCCKLTLEVLSGNAPAMQAYFKEGFQAYSLDPAIGNAVFLHKPLASATECN